MDSQDMDMLDELVSDLRDAADFFEVEDMLGHAEKCLGLADRIEQYLDDEDDGDDTTGD